MKSTKSHIASAIVVLSLLSACANETPSQEVALPKAPQGSALVVKYQTASGESVVRNDVGTEISVPAHTVFTKDFAVSRDSTSGQLVVIGPNGEAIELKRADGSILTIQLKDESKFALDGSAIIALDDTSKTLSVIRGGVEAETFADVTGFIASRNFLSMTHSDGTVNTPVSTGSGDQFVVTKQAPGIYARAVGAGSWLWSGATSRVFNGKQWLVANTPQSVSNAYSKIPSRNDVKQAVVAKTPEWVSNTYSKIPSRNDVKQAVAPKTPEWVSNAYSKIPSWNAWKQAGSNGSQWATAMVTPGQYLKLFDDSNNLVAGNIIPCSLKRSEQVAAFHSDGDIVLVSSKNGVSEKTFAALISAYGVSSEYYAVLSIQNELTVSKLVNGKFEEIFKLNDVTSMDISGGKLAYVDANGLQIVELNNDFAPFVQNLSVGAGSSVQLPN